MAASESAAEVWSDWAIPPGDFLSENLEALGMTQSELAARMGRPAQAVSEIIRGKKAITSDTALELEAVLGVPAHIWTGLEAEYQLTLARLREREDLNAEADLAKRFPVSDMAKRGWIPRPPRGDMSARVQALREFFGVASLKVLGSQPLFASAALRLSDRARPGEEALIAWLRQGEKRANEADTPPFDKDKLESSLGQLRSLTLNCDPDEVVAKMSRFCHDAGVALVLVPELPKTGANGCARWLRSGRPMIQMNLRSKWADVFWFTFFHEVRHILQRRLKHIYVDRRESTDDADELSADRFAADILIPPADWHNFASSNPVSEREVCLFAESIQIHPGIVVGRAQRELWKDYSRLNKLRTRYEWSV